MVYAIEKILDRICGWLESFIADKIALNNIRKELGILFASIQEEEFYDVIDRNLGNGNILKQLVDYYSSIPHDCITQQEWVEYIVSRMEVDYLVRNLVRDFIGKVISVIYNGLNKPRNHTERIISNELRNGNANIQQLIDSKYNQVKEQISDIAKNVRNIQELTQGSQTEKSNTGEWELKWFEGRVNESIANLSKRYSADLDIEIEHEKIVDIVINGYSFLHNAVQRLLEINAAMTINFDEIERTEFENRIHECLGLLNEVDQGGAEKKSIQNSFNCIKVELVKLIKKKKISDSYDKYVSEIEQLGQDVIYAISPLILITGKAGIGKSHFLAHCARKCIDRNSKCILILGNLLNQNKPLILQIQERLQLSKGLSFEDILDGLDLSYEKTQKRSIIFFDAINEGNEAWNGEILGFVEKIKQHRGIGLIMSLRSNSNRSLQEDLEGNDDVAKIELQGFRNSPDAVKRFFNHFNIPMNMSEYFRYEFRTPLFLKIYCESYPEQKKADSDGLKSILNCYFHNINNKLSNELKYSNRRNIVKEVLNIFVDLLLETGKWDVEYGVFCKRLYGMDDTYKTYKIVDVLINESIFSCVNIGGKYEDVYILYFEYELFRDYLVIDRILDKMQVRQFKEEVQLKDFFSSKNPFYSFIDTFSGAEMLAILLPDIECLYKEGGYEVFYWSEKVKRNFDSHDFYKSLLWRNIRSIKPVSYSYLLNEEYLSYDYDMMYDLFETILQLCITKDHYYNITYLDKEFHRFDDKAFNRHWTGFVSSEFFEKNVYKNLIYLANNQYKSLDVQQQFLLDKTIAWCLVSLDHRVREECLISLYENYKDNISKLIRLIRHFSSYSMNKIGIVLESLYFVALNCVYRASDREGIQQLCTYIEDSTYLYHEMFDEYFMIDEYRKCILRYGISTGYTNFTEDNSKKEKYVLSHVKDIEVEKFIRNCNLSSDDQYYLCVESNEKEELFEEYYQCNNNIIYSLMSQYKTITSDYESINTLTEKYLECILPEYREDFCKNVILEIFSLGYNYVRLGFHDYWNSDKNYIQYMVQNYERIAFNIVLKRYIMSVGRVGHWTIKDIVAYNGTWFLTYYESYDLSLHGTDAFLEECELCSVYDYDTIKESIYSKNIEYVRIDGGSNKVISVITPNNNISSIQMQSQIKIFNDIEGIYFSELFVSKNFFNYCGLLNEKYTGVLPITFDYTWDEGTFVSFSFLNPYIYQKMNIMISDNKMSYFKGNQLICINKIMETRINELYINKYFLNNFLLDNDLSVIWIFKYSEEESKYLIYNGNDILSL